MYAYVNHAAICVTDFDWYKNFFQTVCEMEIYREDGEAPKRRCWFKEGIQIDEKTVQLETNGAISHIGLLTADVPALVAKAIEAGCSPIEGMAAHWMALPNGIKLEVKQLGKLPEHK